MGNWEITTILLPLAMFDQFALPYAESLFRISEPLLLDLDRFI
jgi:hypothetical protein